MSAWWELLWTFILRGMARERTRSLVTVVGVCAGVAVIVAVRLANRSVLASFRAAIESVSGRVSLEIARADDGPIDELRLADLGWLREFGEWSPVVEGYGFRPDPAAGSDVRSGRYIRILGIDALVDRPLRGYHLRRADGPGEPDGPTRGRELLDLLSAPDAVLLGEELARREGVTTGSPLRLLVDDREVVLRVQGLVRDEEAAAGRTGELAIMDIAAAQLAFGRLGRIDRVDVRLADGLTVAAAEREITARLPAGLRVRDPARRAEQMETMIASFHLNLSALASLALLVGLFLVWSTASFSVLRRRREIGRLRAAGVSRPLIFSLFLGEALVLSLPGVVLGTLAGRVLATGAIHATSATVRTFYIAEVATGTGEDLGLGAGDWGLSLAVALPLCLLAALFPARDATRIPPVGALRPAVDRRPTLRSSRRRLAAFAALSAAALLACRIEPLGDLPVGGYLAALLVIAATVPLVPDALALSCRLLELAATRLRLRSTTAIVLGARNLSSARSRVAVTATALSLSLATTISIAILIESFRGTVVYWLDQTLSADLYVRPAALTSSLGPARVSSAALAEIRADPDVAALDELHRREVDFRGSRITLGGRRFAAIRRHGGLEFRELPGGPDALGAAAARGEALVSESFSLRFRLGAGDRVELPTPDGPRRFAIAGVFHDYSNHRGVVLLDLPRWLEVFAPGTGEGSRPSHIAVHLRPGRDPSVVRDRLERRLSRDHRLLITTTRGVRDGSLEIFDSTFAITWSLQIIAVTVAALGVVAALVTLLLERRAEVAMLRLLGATGRQIRGVIVTEAVLLGATCQALGIVAGGALSTILIRVINVQSFGWTIRFRFDTLWIVESTLLVILATAAAGLVPARRAARIPATAV